MEHRRLRISVQPGPSRVTGRRAAWVKSKSGVGESRSSTTQSPQASSPARPSTRPSSSPTSPSTLPPSPSLSLAAAQLATTGRLKRGALSWVTAAATLAAADDVAEILARAANVAFSAALVVAAPDFFHLMLFVNAYGSCCRERSVRGLAARVGSIPTGVLSPPKGGATSSR